MRRGCGCPCKGYIQNICGVLLSSAVQSKLLHQILLQSRLDSDVRWYLISYAKLHDTCILRQLLQGIERVDFWRYRVSVNDSMNDSVTVLTHFLGLSIISTRTDITSFYVLIYLPFGMHNKTVTKCKLSISRISIFGFIRLYPDCTANICAGSLLSSL